MNIGELSTSIISFSLAMRRSASEAVCNDNITTHSVTRHNTNEDSVQWRLQQVDSKGHMGVNTRGKGDETPEFGLGDANANCPPDSQKISLRVHRNTPFQEENAHLPEEGNSSFSRPLDAEYVANLVNVTSAQQ